MQPEEEGGKGPVGTYPPSTEAIREWFRRAYGREASELEIGELERKLADRQDAEADLARTDGKADGDHARG